MTYKFILLSECAIEEIVSNSFLQSIEFELGHALILKLSGAVNSVKLPPKLLVTELKDGIALTTTKFSDKSKAVIIDEEESQFFSQTESQCLFVLQKILRFSKKLWEGMGLNYSERLLSGTTNAAIFPLGEYRPTPFRVMVDRNPMADRLKKRGRENQFLLVYKAGYEARRNNEEVSFTNLRKAIDQLSTISENVKEHLTSNEHSQIEAADALSVSQLDRGVGDNSSIYRAYDDWLPKLTKNQLSFIEQEITGAHRIEGAAGTGKTLCLMLKAINTLRKAKAQGKEFHVVFVTHSQPTKQSILDFLSVIDADNFSQKDRRLDPITLKVCTLSEICADQLRQQISETEFVDKDAKESKGLQLLYVSEAFEDIMQSDYEAHSRFLSNELKDFIKVTDTWNVAEMLQHEISVMIKGRAADSLDAYKKAPSLKYGLPIKTEADKGFIFTIFRQYQSKLSMAAQFDTDDVVLTTIGQLDTPIWRRRRKRDGYDAVFIDETHLFNINELHMFHFFTKDTGPYPIVYSVDRAQAVGDHGWTNEEIASSLMVDKSDITGTEESKLSTIFRSSPQIINLAFAVVSSGATLFNNFDNPVEVSSSSFTADEEKLSKTPSYIAYPNDTALVEGALQRADILQKELACRKGQILIVFFDPDLGSLLTEYAKKRNKPHLVLQKRGDVSAVELAEKSGKVVIGHADFVGGLEFYAVIIVGTDEGRLPPVSIEEGESSRNFQLYASHNRLYVAITRAKFRVEMLGDKSRGPSKLISASIENGVVMTVDAK